MKKMDLQLILFDIPSQFVCMNQVRDKECLRERCEGDMCTHHLVIDCHDRTVLPDTFSDREWFRLGWDEWCEVCKETKKKIFDEHKLQCKN